MCDKCTQLDKQIEKYQRQIRLANDMQEVERLQEKIRELIGQKIGFHTSPMPPPAIVDRPNRRPHLFHMRLARAAPASLAIR
jgi:hypothetical protein